MKTKLNIELLKRLRTRFLRMRHPQHFRMKQIAVKTDCGAAMCMIGHTLVCEGYKMKLRPNHGSGGVAAVRNDYDFIAPSGKVEMNPYDAARRLLKLDNDEAVELFHDWGLRTPIQAADRLQQIIKTGKVLDDSSNGRRIVRPRQSANRRL